MEGSMNFRLVSVAVKGIFVALLFGMSMQTFAGNGLVVGLPITKILLMSDATYGGCMIYIDSPVINQQLSTCGTWLSLDCEGNYINSVRAYRMLDQAQLAFSSGKNVTVYFTDANKYNKYYCTVTRMQIDN
jgi:hypothetical protein